VVQPTKSAFDDAFVIKLNPTGTTLVYATYLGGTNSDGGASIVVDAAGNSYVLGATSSTNFPTTPGVFQRTMRGEGDLFLAKLNAQGSGLIFSTYLGGSGTETVGGLALDTMGNVYLSAGTHSPDFSITPGAAQPVFGGGYTDAVVAKLNSTGTSLVYSTFLGGSDESSNDRAQAVAIDGAGNAYVTGWTDALDFPTTPGAVQPAGGYNGAAFITKLNAQGTALGYSTYLGDGSSGNTITVDTVGQAYVAGDVRYELPTTAGAFDTTANGEWDGFVTKLNPTGSALVYSTLLGGTGSESVGDLVVDNAGNTYVTGNTTSLNFPVSLGAMQRGRRGTYDAFVTRLNTAGSISTFPRT